MSAIRGDEVGHIDRETMAWVRDDEGTIRRMRARVAELESQLEAVTEELGKVQLAYEMSEALRLKPDQSGEGKSDGTRG